MSEDAVTGTLRERQSALTRDAILSALAEIVVENGLHDFSVQDVADRAGISHRTVYRHFESRRALVEALGQELDRLMARRRVPTNPDEGHRLPEVIREVFRVFDERPDLVRAVAVGALSSGVQPGSRRIRDESIREWVAERARGLPDAEVERSSAVIRYLANSLAWVVLTRQLELTSEDAGRAVSWAVETLLGDLEARAGRRPSDPDADAATPSSGSDAS